MGNPNIRKDPRAKIYLRHAHISKDGRTILAINREDNITNQNDNICIVNRDWAQIRWVLKDLPWLVRSLSWSADGKLVAVDCTNNVNHDLGVIVLDIASLKQRRLVEGTAPSWSPDGKRIAFEGGTGGGRGDIYLIDPDGKNMQRITNLTSPGLHMVWGSHPQWSPDGHKIVFRRDHFVWVANPDGTGQACVVKGRCPDDWWPVQFTPRWRPDGKIAFTPYVEKEFGLRLEPDLSLVNMDGTGVQRVLTLRGATESDELCWSPDGTMIAFDRNQNIWVAKADGTEQKRLAGGLNPRWSPDSQKILFLRGTQDSRAVCVMDADGSNQTQITEASQGSCTYHSWCPDGKKIAFERKGAVWIVSAKGGDALRLLEGAEQPCWSPDGKNIAFVLTGRFSDEVHRLPPLDLASTPSLCVMNADGSAIRPLMEFHWTTGGYNKVSNLSWSPDGKYLLFEEAARSVIDYDTSHKIWILEVGCRESVVYVHPGLPQ